LIDPDAADSKISLSRFKREAQSAASLRGTNVVQILDYGIDDGYPFIVMELLEGESLAARLSRRAPLSPSETSRILGQVGKALARAHALQIVHRDLKPDNVFLVRDGEDEVAKVLDFGIAKTLASSMNLEASIQTKSGAILGTPHYMSPEQASGRAVVDHRADIWALGVMGYECMTGVRPFNASTLGGLVLAICTEPLPVPSSAASVPRGFDEWFARCVCRNRDERFQNILEAAAVLRAICDPSASTDAGEQSFDRAAGERTLPASGRNVTTPSSETEQSAHPSVETMSTSARTLSGTHRRGRVVRALVLGIALVGVGAGLAGVLREVVSASAAGSAELPRPTRDERESVSNAAGSLTSPALGLRQEPIASAEPASDLRTGGAQSSQPPSSAGSTSVRSVMPMTRTVTNRSEPGAVKHKDDSNTTVTSVASANQRDPATVEPAPRPDSKPAPSSQAAQPGSIEDRLAF
jgi:serine/threonine-protein kinase